MTLRDGRVGVCGGCKTPTPPTRIDTELGCRGSVPPPRESAIASFDGLQAVKSAFALLLSKVTKPQSDG